MDDSERAGAQDCPESVGELAHRMVDYVRESLGIEVEYDSDTLPIVDHYLQSVPADRLDLVNLVSVTAGAYFGEVVRRRLGGRWDLTGDQPAAWSLVLITGVRFCPAAVVEEAILRSDAERSLFDTPPKLLPHVEAALERMGEVTEEEFYSLCGRLDTLEHLQTVLLAVAAELAKESMN